MYLHHLSPITRDQIVTSLPAALRALMQANPGRLYLAGGFIRCLLSGEPPNDIDLFAATPEEALQFAEHLAAELGTFEPLYTTENAYTIRLPAPTPAIQIIHRWTFADPRDLLESFDFTIGQAVLFCDPSSGRWKTHCAGSFEQHVESRTLVYTNPLSDVNAGGSLLRVIKFARRGYHIPLDSLASIVARIATAAMNRSEEETGLAAAVEQLLVEVDPPAPRRLADVVACAAGAADPFGEDQLPF